MLKQKMAFWQGMLFILLGLAIMGWVYIDKGFANVWFFAGLVPVLIGMWLVFLKLTKRG
jgi:hypothetical protein